MKPLPKFYLACAYPFSDKKKAKGFCIAMYRETCLIDLLFPFFLQKDFSLLLIFVGFIHYQSTCNALYCMYVDY